MPSLTEATSALATSAVTVNRRGVTSTTWLVLDVPDEPEVVLVPVPLPDPAPDPLPDPVPVPPLAPLPWRVLPEAPPDPLPPVEVLLAPPPTVSPTARSTEATVPPMVAVRTPAARSSCAWLRLDAAAATEARSAASWVLDAAAATSSVSWVWAASSWAWAEVTAARSDVRSRVARVSPRWTVSPGATSTAVTVPPTAKDRSAWCRGSRVPVAETVSWKVPAVTVAVSVRAAAVAVSWRVNSQPPTPSATTSTTTSATKTREPWPPRLLLGRRALNRVPRAMPRPRLPPGDDPGNRA